MSAYPRTGILEVMHNVLEDYLIELSRQHQRRPLVLWAQIEVLAWSLNTLPATNEWLYFKAGDDLVDI